MRLHKIRKTIYKATRVLARFSKTSTLGLPFQKISFPMFRTNRPRKWSKPGGRSIETFSAICQWFSGSDVNWRKCQMYKGTRVLKQCWHNKDMNKRDTMPLFILFVGRTKFIVKQIFHSRQGSKLKLYCEQPQKPGSPAMLLWVKILALIPFKCLHVIYDQILSLSKWLASHLLFFNRIFKRHSCRKFIIYTIESILHLWTNKRKSRAQSRSLCRTRTDLKIKK